MQKVLLLADPEEELDGQEGLGHPGHVVAVPRERVDQGVLVGDHRLGLLLGDIAGVRLLLLLLWLLHQLGSINFFNC